jgi:hypothetical protein
VKRVPSDARPWEARVCVALFLTFISVGWADQPPLVQVLERVATYVRQFEEDFASILGDENYEQKGTRMVDRKRWGTNRRIRSEMFFAWIPERRSWLTARNVLTVDGAPVPDSKDRLNSALAGSGPDLTRRLQQLRDEGARFNVGQVYRNFNDPTIVLQFLDPEYQPHFSFSIVREEKVNGVDTWKITFAERARPTVIQKDNNQDLLSDGLVWVTRAEGAVARTSLTVTDPATNTRADIIVDYGRSQRLGMWVPVQMVERYAQNGFRNKAQAGDPVLPAQVAERIECVARYSNFRRFETSARIVAPK